jgi:hypothetical protein
MYTLKIMYKSMTAEVHSMAMFISKAGTPYCVHLLFSVLRVSICLLSTARLISAIASRGIHALSEDAKSHY